MPVVPKFTQTRPASITGVGEAWLFLFWIAIAFSRRKISTSWSSLPVDFSTQSAWNESPFSSAAVIQIWSPQSTGEE